MKPSIQLGSQENATVQYTPLKTYGEVLEFVLELHRAYYREKDDGAKHQLPNRPQLERGGTHLTTSENHRRLSTQSECSDSVICLQGETHFFLSIFLPRSTTPTHVFFRSINSPVCYLYHPRIRYSHFSSSRYVLVCKQCTACQSHLLSSL